MAVKKNGHKILRIDSTGALCTAALFEGSKRFIKKFDNAGSSHSAELLNSIDKFLSSCGTTLKSIDIIGVYSAPGGSTGIKVGIATAEGLSLGAGCPSVKTDRFDILKNIIGKNSKWTIIIVESFKDHFSWLVREYPSIKNTSGTAFPDAPFTGSFTDLEVFLDSNQKIHSCLANKNVMTELYQTLEENKIVPVIYASDKELDIYACLLNEKIGFLISHRQ